MQEAQEEQSDVGAEERLASRAKPGVDVGPARDDQPREDIGLGQGNMRIIDDRTGDDPARLGGDVAGLVH
jgi:hypothetical protein